MQKHHDLADDLLVGPAGGDLGRSLLADAADLLQACGGLLDDLEDPGPKGLDQAAGVDGTDSLDHPRAEVAFDSGQSVRRRDLEKNRPKLLAMLAVRDPVARGGGVFARGDDRCVTDQSDEIALTLDLQAQDAIAAVSVVKRHPLDEPIKKLETGPCRSFGQGDRLPEILTRTNADRLRRRQKSALPAHINMPRQAPDVGRSSLRSNQESVSAGSRSSTWPERGKPAAM